MTARMTYFLLTATLAIAFSGCSKTTTERLSLPPLNTVPHVEIDRYTGTWYEIASFPQSFQEGCTGTTATYQAREDGRLDVINRCRQESLDGPLDEAKGLAKVVEPKTNAKLKVSFFRPFWGDYWIIELGDDYDYAVVGHPSRDYLWILSRTPQMQESQYDEIVHRLKERGYEIARLEKTLQPTATKD